MNGSIDDKVMIKVTIVGDENPELFQAVSCVKCIRRRSARIRDLAIKGLVAERAGADAGSLVAAGNKRATPSIAEGVPCQLPMDTVDAMLDWGS